MVLGPLITRLGPIKVQIKKIFLANLVAAPLTYLAYIYKRGRGVASEIFAINETCLELHRAA